MAPFAREPLFASKQDDVVRFVRARRCDVLIRSVPKRLRVPRACALQYGPGAVLASFEGMERSALRRSAKRVKLAINTRFA